MTRRDGIVIVGIDAGHRGRRAAGTLSATMTPIAPAFWAFFTLTVNAACAAIDERDLAGQRTALGSAVQAS